MECGDGTGTTLVTAYRSYVWLDGVRRWNGNYIGYSLQELCVIRWSAEMERELHWLQPTGAMCD